MIRLTRSQLANVPGKVKERIAPGRKKSREQIAALKQLNRRTPQNKREGQRQKLERLYRAQRPRQ